jgi:glycerophosphoryl diester phosphodiesterase
MSYKKKYDLKLLGEWVHGVGPDSKYVMSDAFNSKKRSEFVDEAHTNYLAVHPYTLRDDKLLYTNSTVAETKLYIDKGCDGVFTEFPHGTYNLFLAFGTKANFPPKRY